MKKLFKILLFLAIADIVAYLVWKHIKSQQEGEVDLSPMAFCREICELMGKSGTCGSTGEEAE